TQARPSKRVLFIGNSYTDANDLPQMVSALARANDEKLETVMDAPGGMTLEGHLRQGNALGSIGNGRFDWVVLQEQSQLPSFAPQQVSAQMYPATRQLNTAIRQHGAKTLLYMTWGHRGGDPSNTPGDTYAGMQARLKDGYENIAREQKIPVAPVGVAWQNALTGKPGLNLWQGDGSHPTTEGTYLAACVFYEIFYGRSCRGNGFTAGL
ncbi:unnamed protein product, partial [Phaeothamnion confervicola]